MTLPDTSKWLLPDEEHPSLEQLRLYHEETLPAAARHQVEKHLLDCELCADVLAGMDVSNTTQTQAAVSDLKTRIKARTYPEQVKKVRPLYAPMLQVAAALVILLIGAGLFRYLQQPDLAPAPEKQKIAQHKPMPAPSVIAPPDPVIKPAEPKPQVVVAKADRTQRITRYKVKKAPITIDSPTDELFTVDSSAVLEAFGMKTKDTPAIALTNTLPTQAGNVAVESVKVTALTAVPAGNKQMEISLRRAGTFTGQRVSGKVTGASGQPLPGVTVLVKGTTAGVTTDAAGNFSLNVPHNNDVLSFNYIGYEPQEQKIDPDNNQLAIRLKADEKSLSEVVVVGHGEPRNISIEVTPAKPEIGRKEFNKYIRNNLRYPAETQQQKIKGQVEVGFTVTETGALTDFKILKSLSPACDAEAIRLIKEGPAWQPRRFQQQAQPEEVRVTVRF